MRITLTTQGGPSAGVRLPSRTVLLTRLDPASADSVRALAATLARDTSSFSLSESLWDGQCYTLKIEDDGEVTEVNASDATMSPAFAKLLELIEELG